MGELALLVPSRGRPHNIARLIEAMDKTCRGDTTLTVGVDYDDPAASEYLKFTGCEIFMMDGMRGRLVGWLNELAGTHQEGYSCLGHIGDDNIPRTVGWDVRIMESLERNLFCFGNDLDPGRVPGSLSIHIFMRSEVVKRLGYMGPPAIQHMYVDPVWYAWGKATSIEYLDDVILEHMHYSLGKSPGDESYDRSTGLIPADCERYNQYCDDPEGMNADIDRLEGVRFDEDSMARFNRELNIPRRFAA